MNAGSPSAAVLDPKVSYIRDVWHDNLEQEMANIRQMIINYPVISMVRQHPVCGRPHARLPCVHPPHPPTHFNRRPHPPVRPRLACRTPSSPESLPSP